MPNFAASNALAGTQQAISSTYKTLLALTAQTTGIKRAKVYDFEFGTNGTPADNYMECDISRQTAAGTSTPVTPNPLDPADGVAVTVGSANFTAEGTITAASSLFYLPWNQRASFRWVAAPGSELVIPATNLAGLAARCRSGGYTGTAGFQGWFNE